MFQVLYRFLGQLRIYLMWRFVQLFSVKPFLKIDPNEYCPACGDRVGHIGHVTDGQSVQIRHYCETCGYAYDVETVTKIDPATIIPLQLKEEGDESPEKPARFVKIPLRGEDGVRVNGKELPEKTGVGDRKKAVTAAL